MNQFNPEPLTDFHLQKSCSQMEQSKNQFSVSLDLAKVLPVGTQNGVGQAVNARDLHTVLEVKTRFNDWILRRLAQAYSVLGIDYLVLEDHSNLSNVSDRKDYALTLSLAKKIAMMEGGKQGNIIREYFLECEQKLLEQTKPKEFTLLEALEIAAQSIRELEHTKTVNLELENRVATLEPKAQAFERVINAEGLHLVNQVAKIIGNGCGEYKLFALMRHKKILMTGRWHDDEQHNMPYQKYLDTKTLDYKINTRQKILSDGSTLEIRTCTPFVTGKGIEFLKKVWDTRAIQQSETEFDSELDRADFDNRR